MLLIKRLQPPYQGQWALVGGKWISASARSVAVREVKEETGLDWTDFVALRYINERVAPDDDVSEGGRTYFFYLRCRRQK